MNAKQEIIALANRCGIDVDEDGDIMGSTNGSLLVFAVELLKHAQLALAASAPTLGCGDPEWQAKHAPAVTQPLTKQQQTALIDEAIYMHIPPKVALVNAAELHAMGRALLAKGE